MVREHASRPVGLDATAAPPAAASAPGSDVLALQRTAGNRAVARAVVPVPVQTLRVAYAPVVAPTPACLGEFNRFAAWLDGLVTTAHNQLSRLHLGNWILAATPRITTFLTGWTNHCATPAPAGALTPPSPTFLNAWAGSALESYVCDVLIPSSGAPLAYALQVSHGSTTPDIVATSLDGTEEAWFDITCVSGHILTKASWLTRTRTTFVEEIVYPNFDLGAMYTAHHAGAQLTRQRRELIEAARFVRGEDARTESKAKRKIKALWDDSGQDLRTFSADLGVNTTQGKKVLYYGGIDRYDAGKHPKGAKQAGKQLWHDHGR